MLYLHGASGTDYQYIHLNNDLGNGNDNRGSCTAGTAYVVKAFPDGGSAKLPGQSVTLSLPVGLAGPSDLAGRRVIVLSAPFAARLDTQFGRGLTAASVALVSGP